MKATGAHPCLRAAGGYAAGAARPQWHSPRQHPQRCQGASAPPRPLADDLRSRTPRGVALLLLQTDDPMTSVVHRFGVILSWAQTSRERTVPSLGH